MIVGCDVVWGYYWRIFCISLEFCCTIFIDFYYPFGGGEKVVGCFKLDFGNSYCDYSMLIGGGEIAVREVAYYWGTAVL